MPTALLDLPADQPRSDVTEPHPQLLDPRVLTGLLLGRDVVLHAASPVPHDPVHHLLEEIDVQWDPRRRHSDLDRLTHHPGVVRTVSPVTLVLVRNTLSCIRLVQRAGVVADRCDATLDARHHRAGLDPTAAAIAARLVPATAVDLVVDLCRGHGACTGHVRVGDVQRDLQDPVPAWLRRVAEDTCGATAAVTRDGPGDPAPVRGAA